MMKSLDGNESNHYLTALYMGLLIQPYRIPVQASKVYSTHSVDWETEAQGRQVTCSRSVTEPALTLQHSPASLLGAKGQ